MFGEDRGNLFDAPNIFKRARDLSRSHEEIHSKSSGIQKSRSGETLFELEVAKPGLALRCFECKGSSSTCSKCGVVRTIWTSIFSPICTIFPVRLPTR